MEASQTASAAFCRDLTSSLIPTQNLTSVHMSRRAGPLATSHWCTGGVSVGGTRDVNFPI